MGDSHFLIGGSHIPEPEFDATIIEAEVVTTDYTDSTGAPREALRIHLETDDGKDRYTTYAVSDRPNSKWYRLMHALGELGIKSIQPEDLVGQRFRFREEALEYGNGINGILILPIKKLPQQETIGQSKKIIEPAEKESEEQVQPDQVECLDLIRNSLKGGNRKSKVDLAKTVSQAGFSREQFQTALKKLVDDGEIFDGERGYELFE